MEEAAVLFSKAATLYREGGFADSAAQTLEKAAKYDLTFTRDVYNTTIVILSRGSAHKYICTCKYA